MVVHIDLDEVLLQLLPIKPDYLTVSAAGILSAAQIIDLHLLATLINPVVGVIVIRGNFIASCSTSEHKCWVVHTNVRNLRNNFLADKALVGCELHARKIGYAAKTNYRTPTLGNDARAIFDFASVFNGHTVDVNNALIIETPGNATETFARLSQLGAFDRGFFDFKCRACPTAEPTDEATGELRRGLKRKLCGNALDVEWLRIGAPRHRADDAAEYRRTAAVAVSALERATGKRDRGGRRQIVVVQLTDDGADALRFIKLAREGHTLTRIDLVVTRKRSRRCKAGLADETTDILAVRIANGGGTRNLLIFCAQRELSRLPDEAAAGSGTFDGERVQVESFRDVDCGARVRTDEAHDTTGGTAFRLNSGSANGGKGANVQSRAVLDCTHEQAGITEACLDDTAWGKVVGKRNRFHGEGSTLDRIRQKPDVARRVYIEVLSGTGEAIGDVNSQVARRLAQKRRRQGGSLIIARIGAHGIHNVNRHIELLALAANFRSYHRCAIVRRTYPLYPDRIVLISQLKVIKDRSIGRKLDGVIRTARAIDLAFKRVGITAKTLERQVVNCLSELRIARHIYINLRIIVKRRIGVG